MGPPEDHGRAAVPSSPTGRAAWRVCVGGWLVLGLTAAGWGQAPPLSGGAGHGTVPTFVGQAAVSQDAQTGPQTGRGEANATSEPVPSTRAAGDRRLARQTLMVSITIFVLSIFVGVELITKVPATLHTPLMSGSNAISGITLVGALIAAGGAGWAAPAIAWLAVVLAAVNVVGGFLVTHRMLRMFDRR